MNNVFRARDGVNLDELVEKYTYLELAVHEATLFIDRMVDMMNVVLPDVKSEILKEQLAMWIEQGRRAKRELGPAPHFRWPKTDGSVAPMPSVPCPHCQHPSSGNVAQVAVGVDPIIQCSSCHGRFTLVTTTLFDIQKLPQRDRP